MTRYIYKNVSPTFKENVETIYDSYDDFKVVAIDDDADCEYFGFSDRYTSTDSTGSYAYYYGSNGRVCYEYDYSSYDNANSGTSDLAVVFNY